MRTPFFSLLIGTIDRVEPVIETVGSFFSQEGIDPEDIEVVIADSSRDDRLKERIDLLNDKRIIYVRTPNNDPSLAWDFAYKNSTGSHIYWFGDDDYLLPGALKLFKEIFERTRTEVITAHYMYYYDHSHFRSDRRDRLGVIAFDGKEYKIDPREILKALYGFKNGGAAIHFRFAAISNVFARVVCERAEARLGFVVLPHMRTFHSQQPILFAFAESCIGVSLPVALVSRTSASMSQNFSFRKKKSSRPPTIFTHSPVTGEFNRNQLAESYLSVKKLLPEKYEGIDFNMSEFLAYRYAPELFFSSFDFTTSRRLWRELASAVETYPDLQNREKIQKIVSRLSRKAYLVQPLKFFGVWNRSKDVYQKLRRLVGKDKRVVLFGSSEYLIELEPYKISGLSSLAHRAREIVLEKTGNDISLLKSGAPSA